MDGSAIAKAQDLPKLVGYRQLEEIYGWKRRTIQDWVAARAFPKPADMPGRERWWHLSDILAWLEKRRQGLVRLAVSDPDKLEAAEVERAALDLAARHLSAGIGRPVAPADVFLSAAATPEEADAIVAAQVAHGFQAGVEAAESLGRMHAFEAIILVHCLLPQVRSFTEGMLSRFNIKLNMSGADLREVGLALVMRAASGTVEPSDAQPGEVVSALVKAGALKPK